ncbi:MAG TPA: anhydro-N-acetylmuramic acid kinase, partial [Cyclobacteriaceae bacterium]|nr:anhydro-N-acetylmuramic acid kinase [Cyclobacteriaceae bacterium]
MNSQQIYKAIGLMSGTSLDGVDIACCTFRFDGHWGFSLEAAQTVPYSARWVSTLKSAHTLSAEKLLML